MSPFEKDSMGHSFQAPADALAHYGVKGMKWGVRKDREGGGGRGSGQEKLSGDEAAQVRALVSGLGVNEEALADKYGPPRRLTDEQKKRIAMAAAGIGVAAAVGYLAYGTSVNMSTHNANVSAYSKQDKDKGLDLNWDEGVDLAPGALVKRISTAKETEVRPGGFFGSHLEEDIDTYKAVLPSFWPQWGLGQAASGGFVNSYQAQRSIKAPSGKESLAIFNRLAESNPRFRENVESVTGISFSPGKMDRDAFVAFSHTWAGSAAHVTDPSGTFFDAVKASGYGALIDFNDAGTLGKTPLRIIDDTAFKITNHEKLSAPEIRKKAREFIERNAVAAHHEFDTPALAHYGVKGMRWGVRKDEGPAGVSRKVSRDAAKDAQEFARAKMFYGEGAGTRRKLIKAKVESKTKRNPDYKKAFDHHVAKQDLGKHATKASRERKRKDVTTGVGKTARGVHRQLTGGFGNVSLASALLAGGLVAAHRSGIDRTIANAAQVRYKDARQNLRNRRAVDDLLKDMGMR